MKKIISPSVKEHCVYFSDFTGKCFGNLDPSISIKVEFNYGSKNDGSNFELHLTDEEFAPLLLYIKDNITPESKKEISILK